MRSHSGTSTGLLNNLPRSKTSSKRFDYKASLLKANTRSHSFPFCNLKLLSFDKKQELPKKHALEIRITFESQSSLEKDILPSTSSISSTVAFSKLLKSFHNQRSHAFETEMFNMLSFWISFHMQTLQLALIKSYYMDFEAETHWKRSLFHLVLDWRAKHLRQEFWKSLTPIWVLFMPPRALTKAFVRTNSILMFFVGLKLVWSFVQLKCFARSIVHCRRARDKSKL